MSGLCVSTETSRKMLETLSELALIYGVTEGIDFGTFSMAGILIASWGLRDGLITEPEYTCIRLTLDGKVSE